VAGEALARLSEADLFGLAPEQVRQSALDYAQLGNVEHPRRSGDDLAAEVVGQRDVYRTRVSVRAGADGRPAVSATCSCPTHRMPCKHALALLYAWVRQAEDFVQLDDLLADLSVRSPSEILRALRDVALDDGGAASALARAVVPRDWTGAAPGEALAAWDVFRSWAVSCGRWPQAALDLAARIEAAPPPLAARQLAWLLRLCASELPAAALDGALARLISHLGDLSAYPEAAVAAVEMALGLPAERQAEAEAVVRAAAAGSREVVEATLQEAAWTGRRRLLLAGAAASRPGAATQPRPEASEAEQGGAAPDPTRAEALLAALKPVKRGRARP
jgi:hypothetical protein